MNSIQVKSTNTPSTKTTRSTQNTPLLQNQPLHQRIQTQIQNPAKFSIPTIHPKKIEKEKNPQSRSKEQQQKRKL